MFLKTIWRQGNLIIEQENVIKQYKEENKGLRDELSFREIEKGRLIRRIREKIQQGEENKRLYVDIIKDIQKELADCESN